MHRSLRSRLSWPVDDQVDASNRAAPCRSGNGGDEHGGTCGDFDRAVPSDAVDRELFERQAEFGPGTIELPLIELASRIDIVEQGLGAVDRNRSEERSVGEEWRYTRLTGHEENEVSAHT